MREIRFRAWNNDKKLMGLVMSLTREEQTPFTLVKYNEDEISQGELTERLSIMQYTGLKDEKGVEIFEWDIVSIAGALGEKSILPVTWSDTCACFCAFDGRFLYGGVDCEVIGNIHENPDLLND